MSDTKNKPTITTNGITIDVEVSFQENYSVPLSDQHVFTYSIRIYNGNPFTVQLLRRWWEIWESNGTIREVRGEGVIGIQPIITPDTSHTYESFCPIIADMGTMKGKYQMIRLDTEELFEVEIPQFSLIIPRVLN